MNAIETVQALVDRVQGLIDAVDAAGYSTQFQRNLSMTEAAVQSARALLRETAGTPEAVRYGKPYLDGLLDRLEMPPPAMTESDLRRLHREAASMIYRHAAAPPAAVPGIPAQPITDELYQYRRQELRNLMRYISEDCYCAWWLNGLEYILWEMVSDPHASRQFGMGEVEESAIARLRELADRVGGWWRWHDDQDERDLPSEEWGERFTPMAEWLVMYARHMKIAAAPAAPTEEPTLPPHLRDDAPYLKCSACGRKSWSLDEGGERCGMPQPDGLRCGGFMREAKP